MQRLGMPAAPIISMFKTTQEMEHLVRTAYGDSDSKISSSEEEIPNQGVLQGNGSAPVA